MSIRHERLGEVAQAEGNLALARSSFQKSLDLTESLAKADPGNVEYRRDLVISHLKLAGLALQMKDKAAVRQHATEAGTLLDELKRAGLFSNDPKVARMRAIIAGYLKAPSR